MRIYVSNLFTNVPLDFTNDLILKKVFREKKIKTKLKKEELKELLEICTKEMHFTTGRSMHGLVQSSFSVHGPP